MHKHATIGNGNSLAELRRLSSCCKGTSSQIKCTFQFRLELLVQQKSIIRIFFFFIFFECVQRYTYHVMTHNSTTQNDKLSPLFVHCLVAKKKKINMIVSTRFVDLGEKINDTSFRASLSMAKRCILRTNIRRMEELKCKFRPNMLYNPLDVSIVLRKTRPTTITLMQIVFATNDEGFFVFFFFFV